MNPGNGEAAEGSPGGGTGVRLRVARQARGYSQQQLAGMAGVSRQAVSAVESGHSDPSLRVALTLAGGPAPAVEARPVSPRGGRGARLTLAPLGDSFVALPLSADSATRAGFQPAGGLFGTPPTALRGGPAPAGGAALSGAPTV